MSRLQPDALDAQAQGTGRDAHLDCVAGFMAKQGLGYGRVDGDFPFAKVRFVRTGNGVGHAAVVGEVGHFDLAEQLRVCRSLPVTCIP